MSAERGTGAAVPKAADARALSSKLAETGPVTSERLLAFFLDPFSYPHRPRSVRLIQTHASWAFLATPYVYKVRKPVNLGFLDFSTLKRRRYFSEREIFLNRRLCADVHLGIVPVYLWKGALTFDAGGEVVEYAVKMRKLEERYFLSHLLKRNEVGTGSYRVNPQGIL